MYVEVSSALPELQVLGHISSKCLSDPRTARISQLPSPCISSDSLQKPGHNAQRLNENHEKPMLSVLKLLYQHPLIHKTCQCMQNQMTNLEALDLEVDLNLSHVFQHVLSLARKIHTKLHKVCE